MTKFTAEDVKYFANFARIAFTDQEAEEYSDNHFRIGRIRRRVERSRHRKYRADDSSVAIIQRATGRYSARYISTGKRCWRA